ncbi:unnamed protein product [Psylliodes chrysocephalus]|uniref:Uncharacterized protein n=1 Tax=Psylliodes chrysocephalus TaxID=3402493 RepID=A0A9P0D3J2_9CUCU|nr:unnamed protein product [Psylliodes chrysocephala]
MAKFANDSDFIPSIDDPDEEPELEIQNRQRQKRRHDESKWSANKNRRKRELGQKYKGRKKVDVHWIYNIPKNERKIKKRCDCKLSKNEKEANPLLLPGKRKLIMRIKNNTKQWMKPKEDQKDLKT